MTKKVAAERFGMHAAQTMNADSRLEALKGGRGGDEEHIAQNWSKSTKAIEKIFQA
jgi:hypothetical protein